MRKLLLVTTTCLTLAACSQKVETERAGSQDVATPADEAMVQGSTAANPGPTLHAPGIAVTAAPGVAFAYRYAFRMPSEAIARAQEAHAQACEKLGLARCRITGMRYRLLGENNVEAVLAFKLDPALARGFGKDAIATITGANGKLVDAEISGTDTVPVLRQLDRQRGDAAERIKRIDAQLADPKLKSYERGELQRERGELQQSITAASAGKAEQQESLATTPMLFDYGSGPAVRGFDPSAPFTSAADIAVGSMQVTLATILGLLAVLGPPGLAVALLWWLWRRFGPRLARPLATVNPS